MNRPRTEGRRTRPHDPSQTQDYFAIRCARSRDREAGGQPARTPSTVPHRRHVAGRLRARSWRAQPAAFYSTPKSLVLVTIHFDAVRQRTAGAWLRAPSIRACCGGDRPSRGPPARHRGHVKRQRSVHATVTLPKKPRRETLSHLCFPAVRRPGEGEKQDLLAGQGADVVVHAHDLDASDFATIASRIGRAVSIRWVRTCLSKSRPFSGESDLTKCCSAAVNTPFSRTKTISSIK